MENYNIALHSIVTHSGDHIASELDNEVVMMSIEQGEYYGLGRIGSAIWRLIAEPTKVEDVVSHLTGVYNVSFNQCQEETLAFIQHLNDKGLILICD
ncbi:lasso peptide biosynthesis PqqD family chaperone [Planctobacterium marinum]